MNINRICYEADGADVGGTPPAPEPAPATPEPQPGGVQNIMDGLTDGGGAPQEPVAAPENYVFNLGEGLTISDELKTQFTDIAKKANLTQESVDALLEMHSNIMLDTIRQAENQKNEWAKQCQEQGIADRQHLGYAKKCIDTFGGGEAMQALVDTGAINHPEVQRMLQCIGSLISEDNGATGGNPPPKEKTDADIMFPNSKY